MKKDENIIEKVIDENGFDITYIISDINNFDGEKMITDFKRVNYEQIPLATNQYHISFENKAKKIKKLIFFRLGDEFLKKNPMNQDLDYWQVYLNTRYHKPKHNVEQESSTKHPLRRGFSLKDFNKKHDVYIQKPKFMRSVSFLDKNNLDSSKSIFATKENQIKDQTEKLGTNFMTSLKDTKLKRNFSFDDFEKYEVKIKRPSFKSKNRVAPSISKGNDQAQIKIPPVKPKRYIRTVSTDNSINNVQENETETKEISKSVSEKESEKKNIMEVDLSQKSNDAKIEQKVVAISEILAKIEESKTNEAASLKEKKITNLRRSLSKAAISQGFNKAKKSFRVKTGSYVVNEQKNDDKIDKVKSETSESTGSLDVLNSQNDSSSTSRKPKKWFSVKKLKKNIGKASAQAQNALSMKFGNSFSSHYQFNTSSEKPSCSKNNDTQDGKNDAPKQQVIQINIPESMRQQNNQTPLTFTIAFDSELNTPSVSVLDHRSPETPSSSSETVRNASSMSEEHQDQ